ncbi:cytochrome P450 [Cubamyces lactineus]|nr:cytochrome P450 [Cubamyces lactineus]
MIESVYGSVVKLKAPFGANWVYTYDPVAVYSILTKDGPSYDRIDWFVEGFNYFLGPGMASVSGETHKKQRKMLNGVFTTKHIKNLTPTFYEVSHRLVSALSQIVEDEQKELNLLEWMGRTSLEFIGQAGLGCSLDPLVEESGEDTFVGALKNYSPLFFRPEAMPYHQGLAWSRKTGLGPIWEWIIEHSPQRTMRELCGIAKTLHDKSAEIVMSKKAALESGDLQGGSDIMTILLQANSQASIEDKLPDNQLVAQISTLLFAATDSTSNALAKILHILCERSDAQLRLRKEILAASDDNDLPYDVIDTLPYLDAICKETLRLYPLTPIGHRQAYRDTTLPFSKPVRATDGSLLDSVFIPKGTIVVYSISACNRNKELWGEDADEWKPERWLAPLPRTIEQASVPGPWAHLMTFSGGAHACIGYKFTLVEMKIVLSLLVSNFTFELSPDKPIHWNNSGLIFPTVGPEGSTPEMWLKVARYRSTV